MLSGLFVFEAKPLTREVVYVVRVLVSPAIRSRAVAEADWVKGVLTVFCDSRRSAAMRGRSNDNGKRGTVASQLSFCVVS